MKVGNKIHKIRELKNITPKDMADRLNITISGYQKIERDEVSVNMERLEEIAGIFEMKPEEVLSFDEKVVFNITNNHQPVTGYIIHHTVSEETKALYNDKIKLLEEKNGFLEERIKSRDEVVAKLQEENELLKNKLK